MNNYQTNSNNYYVFDSSNINDKNRINDINIFYQKRNENSYRNKILNNSILTRNNQLNHVFKSNNINNYYTPFINKKNNRKNIRNLFFPLKAFDVYQKNSVIIPKIPNKYCEITNSENFNNDNNYSDKKLINSKSSIQIVKRPLINMVYSNHYRDKLLGGGRTDITNDEIFDKFNNRDYMEYCKKNREYQLENKKIIEEHSLKKQHDSYDRKIIENIRTKKESENLKQMAIMEKKLQKERQNNYKKLLDEQIRNTVNNKLINENLNYQDVFNDNQNYNKREIIPVRNFLNKNNYVEINPFNQRKYDIGESNLTNNTILNPRIQFMTNKYMFPLIRSKSYCY